MSTHWKSSGLSFLQYLNIAAKTTRQVLKPSTPMSINAMKRNEQTLKMARFDQEGKLSEWKPVKKEMDTE